MTPVRLVEAICGRECDFAEPEHVTAARAAFMANVAEMIKAPIPEGIWGRPNNVTMRERVFFYAGLLSGWKGEISEDGIKECHLAMILPSNRAIISRLLYGQTKVDHFGVPASYGTAHH